MHVDCTFLSESWERLNFPLEKLIDMEGYEVISNPYQRTGRGGRPALIIKKDKYNIKNITNTIVDIPWGLEVIWVIITPKQNKNNSIMKKIALCCFFIPPSSSTRFQLVGHICGVYHLLSAGTSFHIGRGFK